MAAVSSVRRPAPRDREAAVLALARQAVLEDDHRGDHVGALEVGDVEALDAQRRARPGPSASLRSPPAPGCGWSGRRPGAVLCRASACSALRARSPSAPACRRAAAPAGRPARRAGRSSQLGDGVGVGRAAPGTSTSRGTRRRRARRRRPAGAGARPGRRWSSVLDLLDDPAALAADPAAADVEDLDRGLELVLGEGEHVGVGARRRARRRSSPSPARARRCRRAAGPPARTPARRGRLVISPLEPADERGRCRRP